MKLNKNKISYSPTDLNNFVSCKYHIKNDLVAKELNLTKKEKSADLKLRIEYGKKHEQEYFKILSKKHKKYITIDPKQTAKKKYEDTIKAIKVRTIRHIYCRRPYVSFFILSKILCHYFLPIMLLPLPLQILVLLHQKLLLS